MFSKKVMALACDIPVVSNTQRACVTQRKTTVTEREEFKGRRKMNEHIYKVHGNVISVN